MLVKDYRMIHNININAIFNGLDIASLIENTEMRSEEGRDGIDSLFQENEITFKG